MADRQLRTWEVLDALRRVHPGGRGGPWVGFLSHREPHGGRLNQAPWSRARPAPFGSAACCRGESTAQCRLENLGGADKDSDSRGAVCDSCSSFPNIDQADADRDGFGNACDADFTNDGMVHFRDLAILKMGFLKPAGPAASRP